ncbi:hypothetical protein EVA_10605, partial [gut metagenome]
FWGREKEGSPKEMSQKEILP